MECYRRGLEVDELAEAFYQRLMTYYSSWGQRAEAITVYNHCRRVFRSAFGVGPSPRTEEIFNKLKEKT